MVELFPMATPFGCVLKLVFCRTFVLKYSILLSRNQVNCMINFEQRSAHFISMETQTEEKLVEYRVEKGHPQGGLEFQFLRNRQF